VAVRVELLQIGPIEEGFWDCGICVLVAHTHEDNTLDWVM